MLTKELVPRQIRQLRRPLNMRADTFVSGVMFADRDIVSPAITQITVRNAKIIISNKPQSRGGHVFSQNGTRVDANLSHQRVDLDPSSLEYTKLRGRWSIGIPLRGRNNFSHFLLEGVPNGYCAAIFENAEHCNIISDRSQDHLYKAFADLVPFATTTFFPSDYNSSLEIEELRFLRGLKHPLNNADEKLVKFMKSVECNTVASHSSFERIAVLRRSGRRGIANLEEFLAVLEEYDFKVIFPEDYQLSEQVKFFSEARVILGIHGAALSNIVFCRSSLYNPVKIIEVAQSTYLTPAFWILSQCLAMDYRLILSDGDSAEKDAKSKFDDLKVPLDYVRSVIAETLRS